MRKIQIAFVFLLVCCAAFAQNPSPGSPDLIDSLKRCLATAVHDTEIVKLKYEIGEKSAVMRNGLWDSIAREALNAKVPAVEAAALNNSGYIHSMQGRSAEALQCYQRSLAITLQNNLIPDALNTISNILNIHVVLFNLKKALELGYEGLALAEKHRNHKYTILFMVDISSICGSLGDFGTTLAIGKKCLRIYLEDGNLKDASTVCYNIARSHLHFKDTANALIYFYQAVDFAMRGKNDPIVAHACNSLGEIFETRGRTEFAEYYYQKALGISERCGDKVRYGQSLRHLANNKLLRGDAGTAKDMAFKALAISVEMNDKANISHVQLLLKNIYIRLGDYKEAIKYGDKFIASRDSLTNESARKAALQKQFDYEVEKRENQNKLLLQQNQIQALQLSQKNNLVLVLLGATLLLAVIAYLYIRQNKLKAGQKSAELERKIVRSRINPHFMSNCMSAIQDLIYTGKIDAAGEYLAKFSSFFRRLLDSSEKLFHSLGEEIEIARIYIELEQLRFKNDFNFDVNIQEGIPAREILVPTLIMQPFIENAIWHGLLPLQERPAKLVINVFTEQSLINVVIEDNGIGRKASAKQTAKNSKGTSLANDRLKSLNEVVEGLQNKISIIDLYDENQNPSGTKIVIQLTRFTLDEE